MQTINMLPTTKRFKVKVVRQQTVRQKCVESLRWYCSEHSEAVLACPLAKVCIYQHFMILWSLLKALNQSLGVIIPSTLLTQQRAHLQPNGISRQMGRGGRFCREANQKGTVWCSLTDCKACGLVYCLFKLLASEARTGKKGTSKVSWLAQSLVGNLPKAGLKKKSSSRGKYLVVNISRYSLKVMLTPSTYWALPTGLHFSIWHCILPLFFMASVKQCRKLYREQS